MGADKAWRARDSTRDEGLLNRYTDKESGSRSVKSHEHRAFWQQAMKLKSGPTEPGQR